MNTEEKARAYDEALERAKKATRAGSDVAMDIVQYIFPQLAESEDERIREEIVDYFKKECECLLNDFRDKEDEKQLSFYKKALAWLEKQKEQKPAEWTSKDWNMLCDICGYISGTGSSSGITNKERETWLRGLPKRFSLEDKEQKPVEKQDYSGLNDFERAIHRGFLAAGIENVPVTIIKDTAKECLAQMKPAKWGENDENMLNSIINVVCGVGIQSNGGLREKQVSWLKSIPERFNLQPKEEWSDEDTEMYINVASSLRGYACGLENEEHKRHIQKGLDWLENRFKFLRPQPKQEWSEEDEMKREGIIQWLREYQKKFNPKDDSLSIESINSLIDWIKSLPLSRPKSSDNWKPSEEQIEAIKHAYNSFPNDCPTKSNLMFLYRDLKKLM